MNFKLVEQDKAKSRINLGTMFSLLAALVIVCVAIPSSIFWIASGDAEMVQRCIMIGAAVSAIGFGVVLSRSLSPQKRPAKIRPRHRLNY